jgi:hypothetical protein
MVAVDMDGSLLGATGQVSQRNAAALERARAADARVVIATARTVSQLTPVIDAGFTGIAVCMNGAVDYDIAAKRVILSSAMTSKTMRTFITALQDTTDAFAVAVERWTTTRVCLMERTSDPWATPMARIATRPVVLAEPAAKLLISGPAGALIAAANAAGVTTTGIMSVTPNWHGLNVDVRYWAGVGIQLTPAGINKGSTLAAMATRWGIDAADVIAFGDGLNDIDMLRWAGHGVAMGNAHPDVKSAADEIAPHHHDDGVAHILDRWF